MAYAAIEDVTGALPQLRISATSRPDETRVEAIIEEVEAEVNASIATLGFTTPVTASNSVRILKQIVLFEVTARILYEQHAGIRNPDELGAKRAHELYVDRMKRIMDPDDPFTLPDAISDDTAAKISAELGSAASEIGSADEYQRITRDQVF